MVIIDNGHGSDTKGKRSPNGLLKEYEWTRIVSRMLKERLDKEGIPSMLVVPESNDIKLTERVNRINAIHKVYPMAFLISIHNNAAGSNREWTKANGFSIFVSKNSSSKSKKLASIFTDNAIERGLTGNRSIPKNKYWTWPLTQKSDIYILSKSSCPAVLTENLFMDNISDYDFLMSNNGKEKIVQLHLDSIKDFLLYLDSEKKG